VRRVTTSGHVALALLGVTTASAVLAADMLPLKHGIYVDVHVPCKGAPNADTVSYWGGRNGINASKAACTIKKLNRHGQNYDLRRTCRLVEGPYVGHSHDRLRLTILTRTSFIIRPERHWKGFTFEDITYRYCGPKVQF
jgi:hypothetical protein